MTRKLYHDDARTIAFDARVIAHSDGTGKPGLVLDRTAFYPESGGQMGDRGRLGAIDIVDTQIDDAGAILHVVADGVALPAIGETIGGAIDWPRRRVHMALHTGQHMLSAALIDAAGGATVSSRLGESACTIDLDKDKIDERDLAKAEDLCNSVIDDDLEIRAFFPTPEELGAIKLRRDPKVTDNVRVIQIGDFDSSPCGGTHCTRTGQVGLVRITAVERYKGKQRVTFAAGRRARDELGGHFEVLRALGRDFTCGAREVPAAIDKLRRELGEARDSLGRARGRLAEAAARQLLEGISPEQVRITTCFEDVDSDFLRVVAKRLCARPGTVALLAASTAEGLRLFVSRSTDATLDCGALVKRAVASAGGRGGGGAERGEGLLPAGTDFAALVASL